MYTVNQISQDKTPQKRLHQVVSHTSSPRFGIGAYISTGPAFWLPFIPRIGLRSSTILLSRSCPRIKLGRWASPAAVRWGRVSSRVCSIMVVERRDFVGVNLAVSMKFCRLHHRSKSSRLIHLAFWRRIESQRCLALSIDCFFECPTTSDKEHQGCSKCKHSDGSHYNASNRSSRQSALLGMA